MSRFGHISQASDTAGVKDIMGLMLENSIDHAQDKMSHSAIPLLFVTFWSRKKCKCKRPLKMHEGSGNGKCFSEAQIGLQMKFCELSSHSFEIVLFQN